MAEPPVIADSLAVDVAQIETFVRSIFRYAGEGHHLALRAYREEPDRPPPFPPETAIVGADLGGVIAAAIRVAQRSADHPDPVVFCPPIAGFESDASASERDLREGYALSIELDKEPTNGRRVLEALLGKPTLTVASGGEWTDPRTGEIEPKIHLHWRLRSPAVREALPLLKEARRKAATLAGADPSNVPVVHPIRWPGSWHRKQTPRLAQIVEADDSKEIDLHEALERLRSAMPPSVGRQAVELNGRPVAGQNFWRAVNGLALKNIDRWVSDLFGGEVRYQPSTGAWRVSSRALRRNRQEDLSIHPDGIKDFGEHDMGDARGGARTPISLVLDYMNFSLPKDAAFWLCDRLGVQPQHLGWRDGGPIDEFVTESIRNLSGKATIGDAAASWPPASERAAPTGKFKIVATPFVWSDPKNIPRRQLLCGRHLIRKYISATVAPGGVGKTGLLTATAIALASGRAILNEWVAGPLRVWFWNGEDPREEMERRLLAADLHYRIGEAEIGDRLFLDSGRETPIKVAATQRGDLRISVPTVEALTAAIRQNEIDVLIVDPFVESHGVPENDNPAINAVARQFAHIADETGCAIELVHHVRKGVAGAATEFTVEDARGAISLIAAARSARVLNRMTKEEGDAAGVDNHRLFFRVNLGKANLAPPAESSTWYRLEDVALPNGHFHGPGDQVGVVTPWKWPDAFEGVTAAHLLAVQSAIAGKELRKDVQANDWVGYAVAEVLGMDIEEKHNRERVKSVIKTWIASGALVVVDVRDAKGRSRPVVRPGT